jgi:short-subunit dehydrogenase
MKYALITGSGAGIGLATAKLFRDKGYYLGIYDINEKTIANLKSNGEFPNACFGLCDVRDTSSIQAMFNDFSKHSNGGLDVLVNNAGVLSSGDFVSVPEANHNAMIDVNVRGLTHVAQLGFPLLKRTTNSCLVNLCSVSSVHGIPGLSVYSASKFYVNGLTQALNLEWAQHGIRVTCVKPALVRTSMAENVSDSLKSVLQTNTEPEEVAKSIFDSVNGTKDGYYIDLPSKVWSTLDRISPNSLGKFVTRYLSKPKAN